MLQILGQLAIFSSLVVTATTSQIPLRLTPQSHSQGYKFDALLHLPGISPYFDVRTTVSLGTWKSMLIVTTGYRLGS